MKKFKTSSCLGYPLFSDSLNCLNLKTKLVVNTINQYSYCIARGDDQFGSALKNSDVLLPDGIGMVWALRFLKSKKIKKIAGADVHHYLLRKLEGQNGSCFYLGSSQSTLEKIKARMSKEYPSIRVATYSPPYKESFSEDDTNSMIHAVNAFMPDVLFIGLTAPKQEKWSYENKNRLNTQIICSIGAVFDFYAGTVERPNKKWRDLGLEWLGRLIKEPKRMWRRYMYYGMHFAYSIIQMKIAGLGQKNKRTTTAVT